MEIVDGKVKNSAREQVENEIENAIAYLCIEEGVDESDGGDDEGGGSQRAGPTSPKRSDSEDSYYDDEDDDEDDGQEFPAPVRTRTSSSSSSTAPVADANKQETCTSVTGLVSDLEVSAHAFCSQREYNL
jgi:hypothetical protein